jgi:hypothetical protein
MINKIDNGIDNVDESKDFGASKLDAVEAFILIILVPFSPIQITSSPS